MKPLSGIPLFLLTLGLSLGTFMLVLDYSIANVSIPYIAGDLAVSTDQGTYVITSFAVGNAVALPATGWATKRVGAVRLILISLALFVLFSWACGLSPNFETLIISRFLQGFCAGPMIPLSQTLLVMNYPPERKTLAIAIWSTIVIAAPVMGPLLGGWITYDYAWPWIFYINVPVGLISILLVWAILKERETAKEKSSIDGVGFCLLVIGVSCLQIFLDKGEQYDWWRSYWMRGYAITSFIAFILLFLWSKYKENPLIELNLFKIRPYALSILFIAIAYAIYFGTVVIIPLWLQTSMGYTSPWAGIAVAPIGIAPLLLSLIMGKFVNRIGAIKLLFFSFLFFSISCFYTAYFDTDVDIFTVGISRLMLGFGLAFFITPLFALSLQGMPQEKLASATGFFHFVRAMCGAIGTSIFTTMWIRRSAYHHATVGENVTAFSPLTRDYFAQLSNLGIKGDDALELSNRMLDTQASVLAINDCFWAMAWIFIGLMAFLPLAYKKQTGKPRDLSSIVAD